MVDEIHTGGGSATEGDVSAGGSVTGRDYREQGNSLNYSSGNGNGLFYQLNRIESRMELQFFEMRAQMKTLEVSLLHLQTSSNFRQKQSGAIEERVKSLEEQLQELKEEGISVALEANFHEMSTRTKVLLGILVTVLFFSSLVIFYDQVIRWVQ